MTRGILVTLGMLTLLIGILSLAVSQPPAMNFSQYAGFQEYFSAFPRHPSAATSQERVLLEHYRPRLFIGAGQEGPISFYDDYIAHGALNDMRGDVIEHGPTRAQLNAHKEDPRVVFVHTPTAPPGTPVVFARIDQADVPGAGVYTFLTYHFVFRHHGTLGGPDQGRAG